VLKKLGKGGNFGVEENWKDGCLKFLKFIKNKLD
jgi:hypothetical protein